MVTGMFSGPPELSAMDGYSTILGVLTSFFGWAALYFLFMLIRPRKSAEWCSRAVAMIHAICAICLSGFSSFIQGPWPFAHPGGPSTSIQHFTCIVCLGYFTYDVIWCLYYQTEGSVMIFHHLLSMFGQSITLWRGRYGPELMGTLFGAEITNPCLQMRWFLRNAGLKQRWYSVLNDLSFLSLFGSVRIGVGGYLLYCVLTHPVPDWISKGGGTLMYIVSWIFWIQIMNFALRKYLSPLFNSSKSRADHNSSVKNSTTKVSPTRNGVIEEVYVAKEKSFSLTHNGNVIEHSKID